MKKLISLFICLCFCLSASACGVLGGAGEVFITSDGHRYSTFTSAPGEELDISVLMESEPQVIPFSHDFTVNLKGEHEGDVLYSLYDAQGNAFYTGRTALEIPVAVGSYYCIVRVCWGNSGLNTTADHGFCFARSK